MFRYAAGREGCCRPISLACVGRTRSVLATLGLPLLAACVLSPSTLLRLQAALQGVGPELRALSRPKLLRFGFQVLHKSPDSVGPAFCAFPHWRSSGSQELDERGLPRCSAPYPLQGPSLSFCVPVGCALCLFWELVSSCNPPSGCQPSRISGNL